MRKFFVLFSIALALFFVLSQSAFAPQSGAKVDKQDFGVQTDRTQGNVLSISAILEVENNRYEVSLPKDSSAYDLMMRAQETSDFQFRGREFPGLGFFVQELNGIAENPRQGTFWIYYINGEKAKVGISAYTVKTDDTISWNYEHEE